MEMDYAKFASALDTSGISPGALAQACGLKKSRVEAWVNIGKQPPPHGAEISLSLMYAIARMLRCAPADLEYRRGDQ